MPVDLQLCCSESRIYCCHCNDRTVLVVAELEMITLYEKEVSVSSSVEGEYTRSIVQGFKV